MKRAVSYLRVSTEEQALKDLSIPAQRKSLVRWIAEEGAELVREFIDQGESAYAPVEKRPGFIEMINYCTKNQVDVLVVHKFDRFSRYKEEATFFKSKLRTAGVKVQSASEDLDPETPHGFLQETMIEGFAQYFSMNLAQETLKGMRQNAETGYYNGGRTPYGYRVQHTSSIPGQTRGKLILGPDEEVSVVRRIFELSVDHGMGSKAIANQLNAEGVPAPRIKHWSGSSIDNILNNATYVGDLVWFKSKKRGRSGRQRTEAQDRIVTPNAHPAIVDRAVFDKRKAIAGERSFENRKSSAQPGFYLLNRLMVCDHCGNNFVGRRHTSKNAAGEVVARYHYYCSGYLFKGKSVCPSRPIPADWIEGMVLGALRARVCEPASLAEIQGLLRDLLEKEQSRYTKDAGTLKRRIADVDASIERYWRAIGAGSDLAMCQRLIQELTEKKAELVREAEAIQADDYMPIILARNAELLGRFAETFGPRFDAMPPTLKQQAVRHFVERIEVVEHQKVRVHLIMPFDHGGLRALVDAAEASMRAEKERKCKTSEGSDLAVDPSAFLGGSEWLPIGDQSDAAPHPAQHLHPLARLLLPHLLPAQA